MFGAVICAPTDKQIVISGLSYNNVWGTFRFSDLRAHTHTQTPPWSTGAMPQILEALSLLAELEGALRHEQSKDFVPLLSPMRTGQVGYPCVLP